MAKITTDEVPQPPVRTHTLVVNDAELQMLERALYHDNRENSSNYMLWSTVYAALVRAPLKSIRDNYTA
jgi:hypothetical protein